MKSERQENILEILKEKRFATVEFLAKTLYSSAPTIRRDLNEMEEKGFVKRSHGGAMIADTENSPIPIDFRNRKNIYEKIGICKKASQLIKENSAHLAENFSDILDVIDCGLFSTSEFAEPAAEYKTESCFSPEEQLIIDALANGDCSADDLSLATNLESGILLSTLMKLEMKLVIIKNPDRTYRLR